MDFTFRSACGALRKRYRLAEEGRSEGAGVSTCDVQDAERGGSTALCAWGDRHASSLRTRSSRHHRQWPAPLGTMGLATPDALMARTP
jgi:hypothetical protein